MALVVKVGGSLFDLPDLAGRLRRWLAAQSAGDRLLVPGGGPTADVVRLLDDRHGLGEEAAHWLALRALALNAHFLAALLSAPVVEEPGPGVGLAVLDAHAFARADEGRAGCLPHTWAATSDSVAARVAEVAGAELVLLKSVTLSGVPWQEAGRRGWVDPLFAAIVRRGGLSVRAVNLRDWPP
jgi:aspartokinase-like uncharacterized kinase